MTLELVASRVLAPYFGNTNIVWTSIIGIILLSSSFGNFSGGILADKKDSNKCLKIILITASVFISLIPITSKYLLELYSSSISDIKTAAIISTITLFFIPSLLLGFINPIILKRKLDDIEKVGKTSGKMTAISTIGGITGTFLSGFYLIPNFGSIEILFGLSITLIILSLLVRVKKNKLLISFCLLLIITDIVLFIIYYQTNITNLNKIMSGDTNIKANIDTQYGKVILANSNYNFYKVRTLNVDGGYESAMYLEEDKKRQLVYSYTKFYNLMFKSNIDIKHVLMIGGGGYSYPKFYISHYLDKKIDVVEIDEDITRIARKYFNLDDVIKEFNAYDRIKIYNEDGRTFLNRNKVKYDAILNDAFSGLIPPKTLTTKEAINKIKISLKKRGVYLTNIIGSIEGKDSRFLKAEIETIHTVFKNVYVIPCKTENKQARQNLMVIATDDNLNIENCYEVTTSDNDIILTDNYCPVESLLAWLKNKR